MVGGAGACASFFHFRRATALLTINNPSIVHEHHHGSPRWNIRNFMQHNTFEGLLGFIHDAAFSSHRIMSWVSLSCLQRV